MSRYLIKDEAGEVVNRIEADEAFVQAHYPGVWVLDQASVPEPIQPDSRLSRLAFRNRFTTAEKVGLEIASLDDPAATMEQRQEAAALRVYLKDVDSAAFIDLDDPATIAGVQTLEAAGLLEAGRAEEILTAPIREEERP